MALTPGARLGPYEVIAQIGVGGMGEVWRATDTNLKRAVALKVLPEAVAADRDRLARFQREAEVLAALNHPNIAHIHGLEKSGGTTALVMELVEGPTLADRIARAPLPVDEALAIAKQIAEALEAAHEQGIVHRDLKPANVKVREDGTVKVLDFGLAKAVEPAGASSDMSRSPTITSPAMTHVGMILGTAAYMSPEQARGRSIDKRTDIWAFGCVLFEMLTGTRAFPGEDLTDTLATVVRAEPAWHLLPRDLSPTLLVFLRRCLEKDPKQRVGDIRDVRLALEGAFETATLPSAAGAAATVPGWRRIARLVVATVVGAALAAAVFWAMRRTPDSAPVTRLAISTSGPTVLARAGASRDVAITPRGDQIVYRGVNQLLVRALDDLQPTALTGLGASAGPFISPDGRWIGFSSDGQLKKVATTGGAPISLLTLDGLLRGAAWGADNTILFATSALTTGLARVSADGGEPTILTMPDRGRGEEDHLWPELLPDGRSALFTITASSGGLDAARIVVVDLDTGTQTMLPVRGSHARYLASGHLVYGANGAVQAVPFDLRLRTAVGTPIAVLKPAPITSSGSLQLDVSANGTMVYLPDVWAETSLRTPMWVDRKNVETPIVGVTPRSYRFPRISRDGTRVAFSDSNQRADLWVLNLSPPTMNRVTDDSADEQVAAWMPDGRLVFTSNRSGTDYLYVQSSDGSGQAEQLLKGERAQLGPAVTPDGAGIVFTELTTTNRGDIRLLTLATREVTSLVETRADERGGAVSPDGRWLAYESNRSGRFEVYVQPFPVVGAGRVVPVSSEGGGQAKWGPRGSELFYAGPDGAIMTVAVQARGTNWASGKPVRLIEGRYSTRSGQLQSVAPQYDTNDGQRFLMLKEEGADASPSTTPELVVVQNWFEELKRLVPTN